jgi:hypothetical protein
MAVEQEYLEGDAQVNVDQIEQEEVVVTADAGASPQQPSTSKNDGADKDNEFVSVV